MSVFLNQTNLSRRWGISTSTLERWRWSGEGPAFLKLGGRVVYRLTDIEAFEAERLRASTSSAPPPVPDYRRNRIVPANPTDTPLTFRKRGTP